MTHVQSDSVNGNGTNVQETATDIRAKAKSLRETLINQWKFHRGQMDEIEATAEELGISPDELGGTQKKKGGRRSSGGEKRTRGKFDKTGPESIEGFIRSYYGRHRKPPTGADINKHWTEEGRKGSPASILTKMVNDKVLVREKNEDGRGSRYNLVEIANRKSGKTSKANAEATKVEQTAEVAS